MIFYKNPIISQPFQCPYLPEKTAQYACFFAGDVSSGELDTLLERGWRKFGIYFFRPSCPNCRACIPIRVPVQTFSLSSSQKKIRNRNKNVVFQFNPLRYSDRVYEIYSDHSKTRFGKKTTKDEFIESFYVPSCPSFQSEYYIEDKLFGVGFLDKSDKAFNSIYFVFLSEERKRGPGVLSVLREIEYARTQRLHYYYLGYWIEENASMEYKDRYKPNQKMNWETGEWREG
ncbi:MAG: arginyltransferase [Chitinivibrionales bacterium]|nr:arginyltransferase [Chitinivibrionales bacterium]